MDGTCGEVRVEVTNLCRAGLRPAEPRARIRHGAAVPYTMAREMNEYIPIMCPYCGEMAELTFEDEGWSRQSYVQDCPVCCQPWQVELMRDAEGDWSATVKTSDE